LNAIILNSNYLNNKNTTITDSNPPSLPLPLLTTTSQFGNELNINSLKNMPTINSNKNHNNNNNNTTNMKTKYSNHDKNNNNQEENDKE